MNQLKQGQPLHRQGINNLLEIANNFTLRDSVPTSAVLQSIEVKIVSIEYAPPRLGVQVMSDSIRNATEKVSDNTQWDNYQSFPHRDLFADSNSISAYPSYQAKGKLSDVDYSETLDRSGDIWWTYFLNEIFRVGDYLRVFVIDGIFYFDCPDRIQIPAEIDSHSGSGEYLLTAKHVSSNGTLTDVGSIKAKHLGLDETIEAGEFVWVHLDKGGNYFQFNGGTAAGWDLKSTFGSISTISGIESLFVDETSGITYSQPSCVDVCGQIQGNLETTDGSTSVLPTAKLSFDPLHFIVDEPTTHEAGITIDCEGCDTGDSSCPPDAVGHLSLGFSTAGLIGVGGWTFACGANDPCNNALPQSGWYAYKLAGGKIGVFYLIEPAGCTCGDAMASPNIPPAAPPQFWINWVVPIGCGGNIGEAGTTFWTWGGR